MSTHKWEYRGVTITTNEAGIFKAYLNKGADQVSEPSLAAIKKKIATRLDRTRNFDVPCWLAQVDGFEYQARGPHDRALVTGRAHYRGYNLTTGYPRFKFDDAVRDEDVYCSWNTELYGFPVAKSGELKKPFTLDRLERAVAEYERASELFQERLEKIQNFRVPETLERGAENTIEAAVAEALGGPPVEVAT